MSVAARAHTPPLKYFRLLPSKVISDRPLEAASVLPFTPPNRLARLARPSGDGRPEIEPSRLVVVGAVTNGSRWASSGR